jgi:hypothetical protein
MSAASKNQMSTQQNGYQILGVMIAWGPDPIRETSGQVLWTREQLWSRLRSVKLPEVVEGLRWLLTASYVERSKDMYSITRDGRDAYSTARDTSTKTAFPDVAFREEVLTGMNKDGYQTRIENARLPHTCHEEVRGQQLEDLMSVSWRVNDLAARLQISQHEVKSALRDGLIAICNGWRPDQEPHVALFHAHRSQRNGPRRQHLCKRCYKEQRQFRRAKRMA